MKNKIFNIKFKEVVLTACFVPFLFILCIPKNENLVFKNGILDFNGYTLDNNAKTIDGDANFYWQQLPLNRFGDLDSTQLNKPEKVSVNRFNWKSLGYPDKGFGTLHLEIVNLKDSLVFNFDRVLTAADVYINGKLVKSHGSFSKTANLEIAHGKNFFFIIPPNKRTSIYIAISNFHHRYGGSFSLKNYLQKYEAYLTSSKNTLIFEITLLTITIAFGILQLISLTNFKSQKPFFFLAIYSIVGGSRQLFLGENIIYDIFPNISFEIIQDMRYLTYYLGSISLISYYYFLFYGCLNKSLYKILNIIFILGSIYVMITPSYYTTLIAPVFQIIGIILVGIGIYIIINAMRSRKPYAREVFITTLLAGLFLINDMLLSMNIINSVYISTIGVLFFVFTQIIINKKIQISQFEEAENMKNNFNSLQDEINAKENEISELLNDSYKNIKAKEEIVSRLQNVKELDKNIDSLILELKSELIDTNRTMYIKGEIEKKHYDFIKYLQKKFPQLSKTEIEICAYLVLKIDRNTIAKLRNTSVFAVKKTIYRVRKRLDVPQEITLDDFLIEIKKKWE